MKQQEELLQISQLIAQFKAEVELLNSNAQYDINIIAEDAIAPIVNYLFQCNSINVKSLNGKTNYPGIDLIDQQMKIGFQVTSESSKKKIEDTLTKIIKYDIEIESLYIIVISNKRRSYKINNTLKRIKGNAFFSEKNIWDLNDLYKKICLLPIDTIVSLKEILRKNFDYRTESIISIERLTTFKQKYFSLLKNEFSRINFFGLAIPKKPREVDLRDLFVEPLFEPSEQDLLKVRLNHLQYYSNKIINNASFKDASVIDDYIINHKLPRNLSLNSSLHSLLDDHIEYKHLYNVAKRIVVLGNPGAGKSSFIKHTILEIVDKQKDTFSGQEIYKMIPFRVELFNYNNLKRTKGYSFIDYLLSSIRQRNVPIDKNELITIFSRHKTIVFFDGLDEVFDVQERIDIRNDIEYFTQSVPLSIIVCTSRYESYTEVYFRDSQFFHLRIKNFTDNQIERYINKWYEIEVQPEENKKDEIDSCKNEIFEKEDELKRNPLLLSLIVILFRNNKELPPSKFEIYEGCTKTIIDSRDSKEKKITFSLSTTNRVAAFSALAYWQFLRTEKKLSVTHSQALTFVKKYLIDKREYEEDDDAQNAAHELMEFAKVRSVYFENKFTHKTFLEYFVSYYLYANFHLKPGNREQRDQIIINNIKKSSWSVILELLICKIDSEQLDFDEIDYIVDLFVSNKQIRALAFFLSFLKHLENISPQKTRDVISSSLHELIKPFDKKQELAERNHLLIQIIEMSNNTKYQANFSRALINTLDKFNKKDLYCFYKEFIAAGGKVMIDLSNFSLDNEVLKNDPLCFILSRLESINNGDGYLINLKEFVDNFGAKACLNNYKTYNGSSIFKKSDNFNFILYILDISNSLEELTQNITEMRKIIGETVMLELPIKYPENSTVNVILLDQLSFSTKDSFIKKFTSLFSSRQTLFEKYFSRDNINLKFS